MAVFLIKAKIQSKAENRKLMHDYNNTLMTFKL